ncbi:Crp/Fnr family transcriptional regulator [Candidatus Magnetomorum sp. HK-1]|nr:Crp/Fnr family transcriptional regulator [Candidatus Magnetomorum sp. HK-1]
MNKEKTYTVETFAQDQIIFNEGDESKYAYLVQSGSVEIFRIVNNNHVIVNKIKQGELFGEMGIVSSAPRVASAKASEKTRLIKFDQNDVLEDLKKSPSIVNALTHLLINRFEILDNELREQHGTDMFMKVAYLLELIDDSQNDKHIVSYKTLINRAKQLLNATKVEVDNAVNSLSKLSLINVETIIDEETKQKRQLIQLLNPDKLTTVAQTYYETMSKKNQERKIGEVAFLDLTDLANELQVSEERILNRIRSGDIPADLIYFHKASIEKWLSKKTRESFD